MPHPYLADFYLNERDGHEKKKKKKKIQKFKVVRQKCLIP